jgi:hypothetical protein
MLSTETLQHRTWISNRWNDTEAGQDQEIKMMEYACGVGVISMVCINFLWMILGLPDQTNEA